MVFKKRQPKGSPKGGQFAPDMRGKDVPVVEPLPTVPAEGTTVSSWYDVSQKGIYARSTAAELTRLYERDGVPSRIFLSKEDPEPAPGSSVYDPVREQLYFRDTKPSGSGVYSWRVVNSPYPYDWKHVTDEYAVMYLLDGAAGEAPQNSMYDQRIRELTEAVNLLGRAVAHLEDQQAMPDDSYLDLYVEPAKRLLDGDS